MLDNLTAHAYSTAFIIASLGLLYIFDRRYNKPEPDVSELYYTPDELPVSKDLPVAPNPVPYGGLDRHYEHRVDPVEKPEPTPDTLVNNTPVVAPGYQRYSTDYKNEFWPSPRPVNFVKALVKGDHVHIEGRLTHGKAIEILSNRAQMPPEVFLRTDPISYTKLFMPSQYNAAVLLGQSIQRLEDTIRRHKYLADLRRHG